MIRKQSDIYSGILARNRDSSNERWSKAEVYNAINDALDEWRGRVSVPVTYTLSSYGDDHYYDLPAWMTGTVEVQQYIYSDEYENDTSGDGQWVIVPSSYTQHNASGTRQLVVPYPTEYDSGRILTWIQNGPLPNATITLSSDITASDTSMTVGTSDTGYDLEDAGYVIVDNEWIFYAGLDRSSYPTSLVLSGLVRGQEGTTAASHDASDTVEWGVAVEDARLYEVLRAQVYAKMHELFLTDASPKEIDTHQWMMRWNDQKVRNFWRSYMPAKQPVWKLNRQGIL